MMELCHPDWEHRICVEEGSCTVLTIDNPKTMRTYVKELRGQCIGEDGLFVLADKAKQKKISESCVFVDFPLSVEIEDKKVITKVLNSLKAFALSEDMLSRTSELHSVLLKYAEELRETFQFNVNYDEPDVAMILKLFGFHIETEFENDLERILEYMNILHDVLGIGIFIFTGLRAFFSDEELNDLLQTAAPLKHTLVLLESSEKGKGLENTKYILIDKDNCEVF